MRTHKHRDMCVCGRVSEEFLEIERGGTERATEPDHSRTNSNEKVMMAYEDGEIKDMKSQNAHYSVQLEGVTSN